MFCENSRPFLPVACAAGAKRGGGGGREKGKSPSPFSLPPYPLPPTPFDACYAGYLPGFFLSLRRRGRFAAGDTSILSRETSLAVRSEERWMFPQATFKRVWQTRNWLRLSELAMPMKTDFLFLTPLCLVSPIGRCTSNNIAERGTQHFSSSPLPPEP